MDVFMDNSVYLVTAYLVFWLLPFALIISMWVRQRRIQRDIEALKQRLESTQGKS
jgi:hypothetical protein